MAALKQVDPRLINALRGTDAIVSDGDDTLWSKNPAKYVGERHLMQELGKLHFKRAYDLGKGAATVTRTARDHGTEATIKVMIEFYEMLRDNGFLTEEHVQIFAGRYMARRETPEVASLIRESGKPAFLATLNGSTVSQAAVDYFGLAGFVSNTDVYDDGRRLVGIEVTMHDGDDKLKGVKLMLGEHGHDIGRCAVIGDNVWDVPMLKAGAVAIASPFAVREVREIADFHL